MLARRTNRQILDRLEACMPAVEWAARFKTPEAAWRKCTRLPWMLWLLGRTAGPIGSASNKKFITAIAECVAAAMADCQTASEEQQGLWESCLQTYHAYLQGDATETDVQKVRNTLIELESSGCEDYAQYCLTHALYLVTAITDPTRPEDLVKRANYANSIGRHDGGQDQTQEEIRSV